MSELIGAVYKPLFEVRLLHHYWLDEGQALFDSLPKDAAEKAALNLPATTPTREQRLSTYDSRLFIDVLPTLATAKTLRSLGCVFKTTALGFIVAIPETQIVPANAQFEFALMATDKAFLNYTALTLPPQKVYAFFHQATVYRYKENVMVFSNLTGTARGEGDSKALYLSQNYAGRNNAKDKVEALVLDGNALLQLTSDANVAVPGVRQLAGQANAAPVFAHQGDIPVITAPLGLEGVPGRGVRLTEDGLDNLFALIRLLPTRADDVDFSLIGNNGMAKQAHPIFQIRFKNRASHWLYFDKTKANADRIIDLDQAGPALPLTFFGNASPAVPNKKQKPSRGIVKAVFDTSDPPKVTGLISEIFE